MQSSDPKHEAPNRQESGDRLRAAPLFHKIDEPRRNELLRIMLCDEFTAGEVILRQETVTRNVWVLVEGECEVIKEPPIGEYGEPVSLALLKPFDVFGEMAFVSPEPHVASVEARSAVRTLRLRGADFDELIESQPALACRVACNLVMILSDRLRNVDEKLSRSLDHHEDLAMHHTWEELRGRLGKLYSSPRL